MSRVPTQRPSLLRAAVLATILLAGYGIVQWAVRPGPDRKEPATPPPAAADPSNPGILVPGGTFTRGSRDETPDVDPASPYSMADEGPPRRVAVAPFWVQQHEVTNEEYRRFDPAHTFAPGHERFPIAGVTWQQALDYAASLGGRLPTESQWEFAARGSGSRRYPWGDQEPTCERAHYLDCEPRGPIAVMSRPAGATPRGIHDLAGNVWEWVIPDWFDPPTTPVNRASRRMRGGSFTDDEFFLRASNRNNDFFRGFANDNVGFRVVWPIEGG